MFNRIAAIIFLGLTLTFSSNNNDQDRIIQLSKPAHRMDAQLNPSEGLPRYITVSNKIATANEGWKSLENWRELTSGLGRKRVRRILGEPERIDGGAFTYWYYPNGGQVRFYEGRLDGWDEPRDWDENNMSTGEDDISDAVVFGIITVIFVGCVLLGLLPIVWVLVSKRSHGGAKFGWFLLVLCFSWLGFAAFLIFTQPSKARQGYE